MQPVTYDGNAAVLVDSRFPHVELDLQRWCTSHQEVVGVTLQLHLREVVVVSVYVRPSVRKTAQVDWSWLENLRKTRPGALFVIGGDFNAPHTHWGARTDTFHSTNLVRAMEDNNFTLINDIDCPTRISQHDRQDNTTTDLTWTNKPKSIAWELGVDTWGSDHFPIFLRLRGHARQTAKYATSVVYWDRFRETLEATLLDTIYDEPEETRLEKLLETINKAKRLATRPFYVTEGSPAPDVHLANLWSQRLDALREYRKKGKPSRLCRRLNCISAEARDYAAKLASERWRDFCSRFNGNMSGPQIWRLFRSWQGKSKKRTAAQAVALHLQISEAELALQAGDVFFPPASDFA
ncbi:hypothetical protein HPB48_002167 [Haemaphysalis longicornis]|uniref:Endonuclease/exonuclease/phosphatase domain-containing protein n=1 Tax=Haemaphysalis longicornis TaxID=44386 RepID=A0A9J6FGR5_HAELO|nr:hypothetical protein HPB48_002167 [Haemaphysalis longicornis]